jgi:hypothetical protein
MPAAENMQGLDMTVSQLDSFSTPSIAAVILHQEAERLLQVYARQRDYELKLGAKTESIVSARSAPNLRSPDELLRKHGPKATISEMEDLHAEIHSLEVDLDRKLMVLCFESRCWDGFLDRYLEFVRADPENSFVVTWAPNALNCARLCSRTEQVRDALENVVKFHGQAKTAARLAGTLAEWHLGDAPIASANF